MHRASPTLGRVRDQVVIRPVADPIVDAAVPTLFRAAGPFAPWKPIHNFSKDGQALFVWPAVPTLPNRPTIKSGPPHIDCHGGVAAHPWDARVPRG